MLLLLLLRRGGGAATTLLMVTMMMVVVVVMEMVAGVEGRASTSTAPATTTTTLPPPPPRIEERGSRNVTAVVGETARLNCRVVNLGNKTVSWIRHRDLHLLSSGPFTYTSDDRFVVERPTPSPHAHHTPTQGHAQDWLLTLRYTQPRDTGMYECQVSTTPPLTRLIHLSVVEPVTEIEGGPDLYFNVGSRLELLCVVTFSPHPPSYIFWYHDDTMVSYERTRGGSTISTNMSSSSSGGGGERGGGGVTTSSLLVQTARPSHSGNYTCTPSNSKAASVTVHVLQGGEGDRPEAMVGDSAPNTLAPHPYLLLLLLLLLPLLTPSSHVTH